MVEDSDTIFVVLALYSSTIDLKLNITYEVKVRAISFHLRVFEIHVGITLTSNQQTVSEHLFYRLISLLLL